MTMTTTSEYRRARSEASPRATVRRRTTTRSNNGLTNADWKNTDEAVFDRYSVLLDLLLNRSPWAGDAAILWDAHRQGHLRLLVAAFTLPTIFYVIRKQAGLPVAQAAVQACLSTLDIAAVDHATLLAAQALPGPDFEDNLQIACSVQAGADAIVTRDARGFAGSPVPVFTPDALVASLGGPSTP